MTTKRSSNKKRKLGDETDEIEPQPKRRKLTKQKNENEAMKMYNEYYVDKNYELCELWQALKDKYDISRVIYPGSYIQISPSFHFDYTVYIDNDKKANKFFNQNNQTEEIQKYINKNKNEENEFKFYYQDFNKDIDEDLNSFDLMISLYAGFVTDNNLKYVKNNGYILVNNSHNDALNCYLNHKDKCKLIAVINGNGNKYKIIDSQSILDECFIAKKPDKLKEFKKKKNMKTIAFKKSFKYYVFEKK